MLLYVRWSPFIFSQSQNSFSSPGLSGKSLWCRAAFSRFLQRPRGSSTMKLHKGVDGEREKRPWRPTSLFGPVPGRSMCVVSAGDRVSVASCHS